MAETGFCCAGCAYVFRLVHEHGLAGYYNIKDDVTAPADAAVFQPRDYAWLDAAQRGAEATAAGIPSLTLDLQGISCAGCVWLIERIFQQLPGARDIVVNPQYGTMRLRWVRGAFVAAEFARKLQAFGYLAGPAGETTAEPESRDLVRRIGLCAAFAMNIMLFAFPAYFGMEPTFAYARLFTLLTVVFGTLSFLVGGTYFAGRAARALREGVMHIDLPIALGILGAYVGSLYGWLAGEERFVYFDFVGTFILLMLVGRWAQVAAVERNRLRLLRQQPRPSRVRVLPPVAAEVTRPETVAALAPPPRVGRYGEIPPEQITAGHVMQLASGQTVPVESRLLAAEAAFSLLSINGESEPRIYRAGARVPAGAVLVSRGETQLTALQAWSESLLAQLLQASDRPGARHLLIEKIVRGYLIGIIAAAVLSGFGWWLAGAGAPHTWAVVIAVLVVSCPCAIGLAFPLADEIAAIALRRRGVFVRDGGLFARLARVRMLVFDKTGTLTLETPVLQNPEALRTLAPGARAALHALVRDNSHPVSQCLLENLLADSAPGPLAGDVSEAIGFGVELGPWSLGRPGWRTPSPSPDSDECNLIGYTVSGPADVVLARDGESLARFRFADTARPDARAEFSALRARGFGTFILSGDRAAKVSTLARDLGLPPSHALGELTPQAKADWLDTHGATDALMLGDGANDSLAFDRALCRGTPVIHRGVLERKADFYYLGRGLGGLRALFDIDAIRRRTQRAILVFSVAYNLLAVGLAVAGHMSPLVAAILMPINSLLTLAIVTGGMRGAYRRAP